MKTFPNWRMVGRAMRWARQQDGVSYQLTKGQPEVYPNGRVELSVTHDWRAKDGRGLLVMRNVLFDDVEVSMAGPSRAEWQADDVDDVAELLRVLAALRLIPEELSAPLPPACVKCGLALGVNPLTNGWEHVDHDAWLRFGTHRAEVAS